MSFREQIAPLSIIVAVDCNGGFGKNNSIPWIHEPFAREDLKHFKETTKGGICIMGRKTYHDMYDMVVARKTKKGGKDKPVTIKNILPGRESFVISRTLPDVEGATVFPDMIQAIQSLQEDDNREVFIIGGYRMFVEALPFVNTIYLTVVKGGDFDCDVYFPIKALKKFKIVDGKHTDKLWHVTYQRVKP